MVMPTMAQMDLEAGLMMQQQKSSMILESGKFSGTTNSIITQPSVMLGAESNTGPGMIRTSLKF